MRIVIPHVTEYLGSEISVGLVSRGYEVVGVGDDRKKGEHLKRSGVQFCFADSSLLETVYSSLLKSEDILLHVSAPFEHWKKTSKDGRRELKKYDALLEAARANGIAKHILLSSADLYAGFEDVLSIEEDYQPPNPCLSPFLASVITAEHKAFAVSPAVPTLVLRPADIYPDTDGTGALFFRALRNSGPIALLGPRGALMEFTSVRNLLSAVEAAVRYNLPNNFEVFHISDGLPEYAEHVLREIDPFSADDIKAMSRARARLLTGLMKNKSPVSPLPSAPGGEIKGKRPLMNGFLLARLGYHCTLDLSRAKRMLGYQPQNASRNRVGYALGSTPTNAETPELRSANQQTTVELDTPLENH